MTHDFKMELVVTRAHVIDADFSGALDKLREIKTFAEARGLVVHFAIGIGNSRPEGKEVQ